MEVVRGRSALVRGLALVVAGFAGACGGGGGGGGPGSGGAPDDVTGLWTFTEVEDDRDCGGVGETKGPYEAIVLQTGSSVVAVSDRWQLTGTYANGHLVLEGEFDDDGGWVRTSVEAQAQGTSVSGLATWDWRVTAGDPEPACAGTSTVTGSGRWVRTSSPASVLEGTDVTFTLTGAGFVPGPVTVILQGVDGPGFFTGGYDGTYAVPATAVSSTTVVGTWPPFGVRGRTEATVTVESPGGETAPSVRAIVVLERTTRILAEGGARLVDGSADGLLGTDDDLVLAFDGEVDVGPSPLSDLTLPVAGDSFGTGATVTAGPGPDHITVHLGAGAHLTVAGDFAGSALSPGSPSGIGLVAAPASITGSGGFPAAGSTPADLVTDPLLDTGVVLEALDEVHLLSGDVDGDDDADVVAARFGSPVAVWRNDGSGGFPFVAEAVAGTVANAIALADVDGDGDLDLATAAFGSPVRVLLNDGNGTFTDSNQSLVDTNTLEVHLADVDGDGDADLVTASAFALEGRVWVNDGFGTFSDSGGTVGPANELQLADLDGDDDLDVVARSSAAGSHRVLLNDGSGAFTDTGQAVGNNDAGHFALGDLDGDGDVDLVDGNYASPTVVFRNDGNGAFTSTGAPLDSPKTVAPALVDLDGDGDLDLVEGRNSYEDLVQGHPLQTCTVRRNDGSGGFGAPAQLLSTAMCTGLVTADLDGDGHPDLVEGGFRGAHRVWRGSPLGFP